MLPDGSTATARSWSSPVFVYGLLPHQPSPVSRLHRYSQCSSALAPPQVCPATRTCPSRRIATPYAASLVPPPPAVIDVDQRTTPFGKYFRTQMSFPDDPDTRLNPRPATTTSP